VDAPDGAGGARVPAAEEEAKANGAGAAPEAAPRDKEAWGVSATEREVASRTKGAQAAEAAAAEEPKEEEEVPGRAKVNAELESITIQPCVRIEFNVTNRRDCCPFIGRG
jgi:hypothetical protein